MSNEQNPDQKGELIEHELTDPDEAPTSDVTVEPSAVPAKPGRLLPALALLMSLVSLIVVSLGGWFGWQWMNTYQSELREVRQTAGGWQQAVENLQRTQSSLNQSMQQLVTRSEQAERHRHNDLEQQLAQFAQQLEEKRSMSNVAQDLRQVALEEAGLYLRLAEQKLVVDKAIVQTLSLLALADRRLAEHEGADIERMRQAIANDTAVLELIEVPDRGAVIRQLTALNELLDQLPLVRIELPEETGSNTLTQVNAQQGWWENLSAAFKELSEKWFEVRQHGQPVMPMLSAEQQGQLYHGLRLLMQNTQLAVMLSDQALFESTLSSVESWVKQHFDIEQEMVKQFLLQIENLKQQKVDALVPSELQSLSVILGQVGVAS